MELPQIVALGVFTSYFLIILSLFTLIIRSLPTPGASTSRAKLWIFRTLTVGSFAHTWFYMFSYMAWSFADYEKTNPPSTASPLGRIAGWLTNTSLFEQAWAAVCFGEVNWWWSEQLCVYTVVWTLFVALEGRSRRVKHLWAYMVLGQLVAISVASNLFYLALLLSSTTSKARSPKNSKPSTPSHARPVLYIPLFISIATIATTPFTNSRTFLPNLLLMHALLIVPLLSSSPASHSKGTISISISTLMSTIGYLTFFIRSRTVVVGLMAVSKNGLSISGVIETIWQTLHSHPAQSSIGWDIVWTGFSLGTWVVMTGKRNEMFKTLSGIPGFCGTLAETLATQLRGEDSAVKHE